ncbi:MAG TPA: PQQ-dependent dehydrogenase, methanol/ethanol family [Candidatus Acidoferrales bacterium]|jgi:alcohol dehydrogenase (cytochrome c)|nr:PQQ-dependent dehydrogenase, methanol/ethanol family [Candidatus Acidoferrales bacterium]
MKISLSALMIAVSLLLAPPRSFAQDVTYEQLVRADHTPQDWLMYGGDYKSQRYSRLTQINRENVHSLKAAWMYQPNHPLQPFESSPVVVDGMMYVTEPLSTVTALDARLGTKIWTWSAHLPDKILTVGVHRSNRGVAILDNTLYMETLDAHLVALDAKTGAVRWTVHVDENDRGYAMTGAPRVLNGKVIVGVSGGDVGIRGFVDAYDAKTGKRIWRVWTIPSPGEPGSETWGKDMSGTGGGGTWGTGSYDPELNLLYWTTGNPAPDYNGSDRVGDNLYSDSVLAIDPDAGKLKWYFQFTPHDTHDWDAIQVPLLFDNTVDGKPRKFLALANRNGFYYVLDRVTGEFVAGVPFVTETWAKGLDKKGRPILLPNTEPTAEGNLVYPDGHGGTNWNSPSYSPQTKLFYVSAREIGAYTVAGKPKVDFPGFGGGGRNALSGDDSYGAIRALDVMTGKLKWQYKMLSPAETSTLATAGDLVFAVTDEGNFFALDAASGKLLWEFTVGGANAESNLITYEVGGKQYVIGASGNCFVAFSLP